MPFEDLLSQGRLTRQAATPRAIQDLLALAERDIHVAEHTLQVDPDWAFNIAYNGVLQAARAFVLSQGFRTRGADQHARARPMLVVWESSRFGRHALRFHQIPAAG